MDVLYKGVAFNNNISVTVIEATQLVNEAIKIHNLSPLAAAALGRSMIAAAFMSSTLKGMDDRLSVTISGDGVGGHEARLRERHVGEKRMEPLHPHDRGGAAEEQIEIHRDRA